MDISGLYMFESSSANNMENQHLWIKSASLFIGQLNKLIEGQVEHDFKIRNASEFVSDYTELGKILTNYKSDKSDSFHNYHVFYSYVIEKLGRYSPLNVLEIGLGTNNPSIVSSMGINGQPGASLYAFREYMPNSKFYGADIDKDILFESRNIKTCYVDQLDSSTFDSLNTAFGNITYDIIIDDGLHSIGANFNTLLFALTKINKNGWIIIEDIFHSENWKGIDFILKSSGKYQTYMMHSPTTDFCFMYAVHKL